MMPSRQITQGLTLIEMLVVVTIIAILISLLMSAFRVVRREAQRVSCTNNVRQLTFASLGYAQDSDGHLPPYNADKSYYYLTGNFYATTASNNDPTHRIAYGNTDLTFFKLLWPQYLNANKTFYCPRQKKWQTAWSSATWGGKTSYIYRYQISKGFGQPYVRTRVAQLNSQGAMICEPTLYGFSTHADEFQFFTPSQIFFGGSFGFPDGRAQFIMPRNPSYVQCCEARW